MDKDNIEEKKTPRNDEARVPLKAPGQAPTAEPEKDDGEDGYRYTDWASI